MYVYVFVITSSSPLLASALVDHADDSNPHVIDGILLTKFDTIDDKVLICACKYMYMYVLYMNNTHVHVYMYIQIAHYSIYIHIH